ncbi:MULTISPECIES: hypothetical protein [unclassified Synechococcus]
MNSSRMCRECCSEVQRVVTSSWNDYPDMALCCLQTVIHRRELLL